MKKILIATVIIALLFVAGCNASVEEESFDSVFGDDMIETKTDLGGAHFIIRTPWMDEYHPAYGDSVYGDNILKRYDDAQTELNITLEVLKSEDEASWLLKQIAAGYGIPDCMDAHGTNGYNWYEANLLIPLTDISTMDYTDSSKYGPFRFIQYGVYDDGLPYGIFAWSWEYMPQFEGVILFNNILQRSGGIHNPYELQENGIWNWEEYKKVLESCVGVFPDTENTVLPMVEEDREAVTKSAMFSNGLSLVVKSGGGYSSDIFSTQGYDALDYLASLRNEKLMYAGGTQEFCYDERAVFFYGESWKGTLFTDANPESAPNNLEEFGMMPFPYGPEGTPETVSGYVKYGRRLFWTCAFSENDTDDIGIFYEFLFKPFRDDYKYDVGWKDIAKTTVFHHQQGLDNYIYMVDHIRYDYSAQLQHVYPKFASAAERAINGKATAASALGEIETLLQSEISDKIHWITDDIDW